MKKLSVLLAFFMLVGFAVHAQTTIRGTVTAKSDGLPIPGVSVVVKGQETIGTSTDIDGNYAITVPGDAQILIYSFVGMQDLEVSIEGRTTIDVAMDEELTALDEVVVVGYGVKKKGSITGSVSTVKAEKLEQVPVASFDNMLQGQTAGVVAISSTGRPGAAATVRIRGLNSINAGNDPLYVMDGVPISAGDFSSLNPNDIEQISTLKDASATAIYGARAANGVILITTKRGRDLERSEITFRTQIGTNQIARDKFDMMNSSQKLDYEEFLNLRTPGTYDRDSLENINTNWLDEVLQDAMTQSYELSARGGSKKTRYYTSGQYYTQGGILPRSKFSRYNMRLNLDHNASDKFLLGSSITLGYEKNDVTVAEDDYNNNVYNPVFSSRLLNPYTKPYDEQGNYIDDGLPWSNPLQQLDLNDSKNNQLKIVGNVFGEYEIIEGLKFKTQLGADFYDYRSSEYYNPNSAWGKSDNGSVREYFARNHRITWTNLLTYNLSFKDVHNFNVLAGQESIQNNYENFRSNGKGLPNDKIKVLGATTEADSWDGGKSDYTVVSYFGALNYDFDGKYFLDLSLRRDGSSRFGEDVRYANFWSVGASWNAYKEAFLMGIDYIDLLKVSASIGTSGNYDIGNYASKALYAYDVQYNNGNGSRPSNPGNPELTWEKLMKMNFSVEVGAFNRGSLKIELYKNNTTDMLFEVPYSLTSGFAAGLTNIGEMENRGIEIELNADVVQMKDFVWNISTNFSYNKNEVKELYGDVEEIPEGNIITKPGYSYGTFNVVKFAGVNPATGEPLWYASDGTLTTQFSEEHRMIFDGKSYIPPYSGGLTSTMTYKGFTFSAFFSWMKDKYMLNNTRYFIESNGQFAAYGQSTKMLEYWKQPGDMTDVWDPNYGNNQFDSRLVEDASFIRLKNITLAYTFSKDLLERLRYFRSLRLYVQGQNLLTLTDYEGIDPEYYGNTELNAYPQVKTFTVGLDIGF